uniref:PDZ domain-containing protein n=1 Tax=Anopheles farauti TaxID=69004 RepID=A0A182Q2P3_9DIPT
MTRTVVRPVRTARDLEVAYMANLITVRLQRTDGQAWGFRLQGGKDFSAPLVLQRMTNSFVKTPCWGVNTCCAKPNCRWTIHSSS